MRIYKELNLRSFEAWSGAVSTLERIKREGKCEALETILEELYPDGLSETELNDLLWFEPDAVFEWVGLRTESEIESEIKDLEYQIEEIKEQIDELLEEEPEDIEELEDLEEELEELGERIKELKNELANL